MSQILVQLEREEPQLLEDPVPMVQCPGGLIYMVVSNQLSIPVEEMRLEMNGKEIQHHTTLDFEPTGEADVPPDAALIKVFFK
ncbi:hypothetical protein JCM10207_002058 [Rhodosporidiobolus poonsookiae]